MRLFITERLSYDQLFRLSEPKRVTRSLTVRGPPLEIDSYQDAVYYAFNFKSYPSTTGLRWRGYIKFIKPKSGRSTPLQHVDCVVDCSCLGPDTSVLMENGVYRPIKDLKVGDRVITHKGRVQAITKIVPRKIQPQENVYRAEIEGFPGSFIVTGNHPFYTLRGNEKCLCGCGEFLEEPKHSKTKSRTWSPDLILARKFKQGHFVRGQVLKDDANGHFDWTSVDKLRKQEWFLTPWMQEGDTSVNSDLARLLGYYVAEGCLPNKRGQAVRFALNRNERKTIAVDIAHISQRLGFECRCFNRAFKKQRWLEVCVYSKQFKQFCAKQVGEGSKTKLLSATIMAWDNATLRELLIGAILGDGWLDPKRGVVYLTSNFNLATQMSMILNRLCLRNTVSQHSAKKLMYQVKVPRGKSAEILHNWLWPYLRKKDKFAVGQSDLRGIKKQRNEGQLHALRSLEKVTYDGLVYDLTVAVDESFIVHGIAVHNCPDYKYRWAWANKQRGSSQVGPQSLNQAWNRAPRKTNPKGKPGLCKHILAARQYIYGLLASFPSDKPDTADKLNKLTKFAQKRWTDFPGQMRAAKEREAETRRRQALRNVVGPVLPVQAVPAERPTSVAGRTQVPEPEKSTAAFAALQPPPLPKPISGKPAKPTKPPMPPKPVAKIKPAPRSRPLPHGAYALPDDANNQDFKNYLMECVVNANGDSMSTTLNEAIKLVEEMEADELTAAPAATGLDEPVDSAMEPSEPPVSDSAVGADTEEDTALGLLRQMRDFLAQLATALAPEETPEAPEGEEAPGGEGAMPPEPPADENEDEDEEEEEEEEFSDRRPVEQ